MGTPWRKTGFLSKKRRRCVPKERREREWSSQQSFCGWRAGRQGSVNPKSAAERLGVWEKPEMTNERVDYPCLLHLLWNLLVKKLMILELSSLPLDFPLFTARRHPPCADIHSKQKERMSASALRIQKTKLSKLNQVIIYLLDYSARKREERGRKLSWRGHPWSWEYSLVAVGLPAPSLLVWLKASFCMCLCHRACVYVTAKEPLVEDILSCASCVCQWISKRAFF